MNKLIVTASIALFLALGLYAKSGARPVQQPPQTAPVPTLGSTKKREVRLELSTQQELHGRVQYSISEKQVSIEWVYRGTDGKPLLSFQYEPLRFWPTEVASYGDNMLLVAGKDTLNGSTVIERWTFDSPDPLPAPKFDTATDQIDESGLKIDVVERTQVARITNESAVYRLFKMRGVQDRALVQFFGSRHVQVLNLANGSLSTLFAATPQAALPVQPELLNVKGTRWTADHTVEGYVYMFGELDGGRALYLFDNDRDGTIDLETVLTRQQYRDMQLGKALLYVAFF